MWTEAHAVAARNAAAGASGSRDAASNAGGAAPGAAEPTGACMLAPQEGSGSNPVARACEVISLDRCRPETVGNGPDSTEDIANRPDEGHPQETVGNCVHLLDELAEMEAEAASCLIAPGMHPSSSTPLLGSCEDGPSCRVGSEVATEDPCCDDDDGGEFAFDMGPSAYM